MVKLCSGPVKYRHEIIADALDSCLCHPADVLTVIINILISGVLAQLNILVNRDALDDVKAKACILYLLL